MTDEDLVVFLDFAYSIIETIEIINESFWLFHLEELKLEFVPSHTYQNQLTSGSLAIETDMNTSMSSQQIEKVEKAYKQLCSWLKKHYSNKLLCRNIQNSSSSGETSDFWVGPTVHDWLKQTGGVLKQFGNDSIGFNIQTTT